MQALLFDVFGTVVDWRSTIIREGPRFSRVVDWAAFADRWRGGYAPSMNKVRTGELPWKRIDELHRMVLDQLLVEFKLTLTEAQKDDLNRVWHRLQPWPDAVAGLARLKKKFIIAPLSNGNVSLLTNMAKHAKLPRHYKPDPEAYLTAVDLLGLKPDQAMMVAAHRNDLDAAGHLGLATAFVHRPREFGGVSPADTARPGEYRVVAQDFLDLARQLGAP
jgi:2-haloacid dehalogenase